MTQLAKKIADNASFQAFINCYLREIEAGVLHACSTWQRDTGLIFGDNPRFVLELQLTNIDTTLAIGVTYHSIVGRHVVSKVYQKKHNQWNWEPLDYLSTTLLLINNIYYKNDENAGIDSNKLELISRTLESQQVMQHYVIERFEDPRVINENYIDSEQSILFGHWLHPTPKSRQGIHEWSHCDYAPELRGEFQLEYFAINKALVRQSSILDESAEQVVQRIVDAAPNANALAQLGDDKQLLPVHPLQAHWLLHQDYIKTLIANGDLINLGPMGATFTPTSSVRTLYCETLDFMVKLSIPVKITNSLRKNMEHELDAGLFVGNLLRHCDFESLCPNFATIDDPAYITATLPGMNESGFEMIIRDNPFSGNKSANEQPLKVQSIAAIVQAPLRPDHQSRLVLSVLTIAKRENITPKAASIMWFDAYWECAIESAIKLYDTHGIALEAHQQNSLLDLSEGLPTRYYYRDNQGFYLSKAKQAHLLALEPNLSKTEDLFYEDSVIRDRFSYYLFINQLFSVINRFGIDNLISERELLTITHQKLQHLQVALSSVGADLVQSILQRKTIPCKGNLLTRISDVDELQAEDELAVYTLIKNPLFCFSPSILELSTDEEQTSEPKKEVFLESA